MQRNNKTDAAPTSKEQEARKAARARAAMRLVEEMTPRVQSELLRSLQGKK